MEEMMYTRLLPDALISSTIEVTEDLHVDIDENRRPTGIEVLGGTDWQRALVVLAIQGRLYVK